MAAGEYRCGRAEVEYRQFRESERDRMATAGATRHTRKDTPNKHTAFDICINLMALLQQIRDMDSMLFECWATVCDGDPTFQQHRIHIWVFILQANQLTP